MNPEIKSRWVEALRSGKYKQGKHCLRLDDSYCCLGVLSDIVKDELDCKWEDSRFVSKTECSDKFLIREVREYCGLSAMGSYREPNEALHFGYQLKYLSDDNDQGKSFEEIADIIEQYL